MGRLMPSSRRRRRKPAAKTKDRVFLRLGTPKSFITEEVLRDGVLWIGLAAEISVLMQRHLVL